MNNNKPLNYVRTHRRRWALTQDEAADLLGWDSRTGMSKIEQGERLPSLEGALALEVLFGVAPKAMFPTLYANVEEAVIRKVYLCHEGITQSTSPRQKRKSELLESALARAVESGNDGPV